MKIVVIRNILLLLIWMTASVTMAQVVVESKLDTAEIRIGEQVQIQVKVTAGQSQRVVFPRYEKGQDLTPGVEVLVATRVDTTLLNAGRRIELKRRYTVTSFDSSLYNIVPYVIVNGDTVRSRNSVGLKVNTLPVDTTHYDRFNGPFAPVEMPFSWTWHLWFLSLLLIVMLALIVLLAIRLSNKAPLTRVVTVQQPEAPHLVAMKEIEKMKQQVDSSALSHKVYYEHLTSILRTYINQRFGINAREMTSQEIINALSISNDKVGLKELQELLNTADLVKFAKYESSFIEAKHDLFVAVNYVNETKQPEAELPVQKKVVIIGGEQRQQRIRIGMYIGIVLLVLASLALLVYLLEEVVNTFL